MTDIHDEPIILLVPGSAEIPAGSVTPMAWIDVQNRLAAVEGLGIVDLSDVDLTGLANGMALEWDADDDVWRPRVPALSVDAQSSGGDITRFGPVRVFAFINGLTVTQDPEYPTFALVAPIFGSGANTVAEGNHTHTNPLPVFEPYAATAAMSGGNRVLVTKAVTLAAGISYVVVARVRATVRGADAGAAYFRLALTIDGNTRTSPSGAGAFRAVQGVPFEKEWVHAQTITGTGAAITVSATITYDSGSGFYPDAGELEIDLRPGR